MTSRGTDGGTMTEREMADAEVACRLKDLAAVVCGEFEPDSACRRRLRAACAAGYEHVRDRDGEWSWARAEVGRVFGELKHLEGRRLVRVVDGVDAVGLAFEGGDLNTAWLYPAARADRLLAGRLTIGHSSLARRTR